MLILSKPNERHETPEILFPENEFFEFLMIN